jgi:hypothetical protein
MVLGFEFEVWIMVNACLGFGFELNYFFIIYGLVVIKVQALIRALIRVRN